MTKPFSKSPSDLEWGSTDGASDGKVTTSFPTVPKRTPSPNAVPEVIFDRNATGSVPKGG